MQDADHMDQIAGDAVKNQILAKSLNATFADAGKVCLARLVERPLFWRLPQLQ